MYLSCPFLEMVLRFEMAPRNGQRSILQYMVPWLANIELIEECHPQPAHISQPDYSLEEEEDGNVGLRGSGWGSPEGTKVVLHNLLYITAKVSIDKRFLVGKDRPNHIYAPLHFPLCSMGMNI